MSCPSVYIIEEQASVRDALADRLGRSPELDLLGKSGDFDQALADIRSLKPDAILVEVKRRDGLGLEVLRQLAALHKRPRIIVLTTYPASWEEDTAARVGADAYVMKNIEAEELIRLIMDLVAS